jgi:hypothetical protein
MFSIAARGDKAIQPLINLIESSSNQRARIGAIYCLHLMGINRTIVGRFEENFVNPKARIALLQLLKYADLQEEIMTLLIRDPWASDIQRICETMTIAKTDCWSLVNGLTCYHIKHLPISQEIPESIKSISVRLNYVPQEINNPVLHYEAQIKEALDSFRLIWHKSISVEDTLFKSDLVGFFTIDLGDQTNIGKLFRRSFIDDYIDIGKRIQYYVEDGKLYICSPETTRKRLINWWTNLTREQKEIFNKDQASR